MVDELRVAPTLRVDSRACHDGPPLSRGSGVAQGGRERSHHSRSVRPPGVYGSQTGLNRSVGRRERGQVWKRPRSISHRRRALRNRLGKWVAIPRPISTGIRAWGPLEGTVELKVQRAHDFAFKLWHALTICQLRGAVRQWHVCMKSDMKVQLQQAQAEILRLRQENAKADVRNRELESKVEKLEADTNLISQQLKNTELELEKQKENASFGWSMFHEVLEERNEAQDEVERLKKENTRLQQARHQHQSSSGTSQVASASRHVVHQGHPHSAKPSSSKKKKKR